MEGGTRKASKEKEQINQVMGDMKEKEQAENFRFEQTKRMLKFESRLAELLPTSENFDEVAVALADVSNLSDFHLRAAASSDGEDFLVAPGYFLKNLELTVIDSNCERFQLMKSTVLNKIMIRKKFADQFDLVKEKSAIIGRSRASSESKRKSESQHGEGGGVTPRSRLKASSSTPPESLFDTTPPQQKLASPRPLTPHPKVREQGKEGSMLGLDDQNTTML